MFAGNFAPAGWAFCNGAQMPIDQNPTLFQLIGTTYGGDGQTTFALPNLQSRVPVHVGTGFALGQTGGAESVTLTTQQIPSHSHPIQAETATANTNNTSPANTYFGDAAPAQLYSSKTGALSQMMVTASSGGSQPHDNMVPFLVVNFILSLFGVFPSQT